MKLVLANVKEVVFISTKVVERTNKDGVKEVIYYMSVDAEGEVGSLPCTLDVYNFLNQVNKYSSVNIACDFDTYYKEFKVINVALVNK